MTWECVTISARRTYDDVRGADRVAFVIEPPVMKRMPSLALCYWLAVIG
jgi:hypothetical protein